MISIIDKKYPMINQKKISFFLLAIAVPFLGFSLSKQPNVILIITDDQGYGDLGFHGNPHIKTPTLDAFAKKARAE